jgi:hypothetical protein
MKTGKSCGNGRKQTNKKHLFTFVRTVVDVRFCELLVVDLFMDLMSGDEDDE